MDTQPGQVFIPHDNDQGAPAPQQQVPAPVAPAQQPQPTVAANPLPQSVSAAQAPQSSPYQYSQQAPSATVSQELPDADASEDAYAEQEPDAGWAYQSDAAAYDDQEPLPDDVSWSASEFVEHPKGTTWYATLALTALVLAAMDLFIFHDWISTSVILIAAAMFGVYAGHKPQTRQYRLSPDGLQIGEKLYGYKAYKAFSIGDEGATVSIMFAPLGRFAPPLTIYVSHDMEDNVLDYLSLFLPLEQRKGDAVDGLLRRIRF